MTKLYKQLTKADKTAIKSDLINRSDNMAISTKTLKDSELMKQYDIDADLLWKLNIEAIEEGE